MKRIYQWLKIAIVNILILSCLLFIFEVTIRTLFGDRINFQGTSKNLYSHYIYSNSNGWRPNADGIVFGQKIHINSMGLRGPTPIITITSRIVLLVGDSVLFGVGVEDNETIRAQFRKSIQDENIIILNTGVIGYSLSDYMNVIQHWIKKVDIKEVILFYTLNDIYQDAPQIMDHRKIGWLEYALDLLRRNSKSYLWIKNVLFDRARKYFLHDYKYYKDSMERLNTVVEQLKTIQQVCARENINFSVVLLPYLHQYKDVVEIPWLPQKLLLTKLKSTDLSMIDARFAFKNSKKIDTNYLYGDTIHFSSQGHKKIATYLLNQGLPKIYLQNN